MNTVVQPTPWRSDFVGGSIRSKALSATLRVSVKPIIRVWSNLPHLPWPYQVVDRLGHALTDAITVHRTRVDLPQCRSELTTPEDAFSDRFILYLHGGAFLVGGRLMHRQMIGRFASRLGARALAVDYRKMHSFSIDDAINDSLDGYRKALELGARPENIVLMGDSAGGYLVLMTAAAIIRQGLPSPGAVVAISPLTDWQMDQKLTANDSRQCALFTEKAMRSFRRVALRNSRGTALESPVEVCTSGLPPVLIQASSSELLFRDALRMAQRLVDHQVPCELQIWPGQVHVFQAAAGIIPEAAAAVDEIVSFVDRVVGVARQSQTA